MHLKYVKGHSGDTGNDGADGLAVSGCGYPEVGERDWDAARGVVENPLLEDDLTMEDWEVRALFLFLSSICLSFVVGIRRGYC